MGLVVDFAIVIGFWAIVITAFLFWMLHGRIAQYRATYRKETKSYMDEVERTIRKHK